MNKEIILKGIGVSPGIVIGRVIKYIPSKIKVPHKKINNELVNKEIERFLSSLEKSKIQLKRVREKTLKNIGEEEAKIFDAHILLVDDPSLINPTKNKIKENKINAELAWKQTVDESLKLFEEIEDEYISIRSKDLEDIGYRVMNNLLGLEEEVLFFVEENAVIVAKDLMPSETALIDLKKVVAFVTDLGGRTSHTAIIARSLEIPAVVGLENITMLAKSNSRIIVDGNSGEVIINPTKSSLDKYSKEIYYYEKKKLELIKLKDLKAVTKDGKEIDLVINTGSIKEAENALKYSPEGVGLFRTEFLFLNRESPPDEEEQYKVYLKVAKLFKKHSVVIRTLDIGGDKEVKYLNITKELNPFMGFRGIRILLNRVDIFKTQLKAILRANTQGNLKLMFPMISHIEEIRMAKSLLEETKSELKEEGKPFNPDIKVGIMIEVPSAAISSDFLAKEVDFFSIGTNDLIQYTMAADRTNQKVSYLYQPFNPAVLRLIKMVIDNGHKNGIWVGMCGEMAGNIETIPILIGFEIDELSVSPISLLEVKRAIRSLKYSNCLKLIKKIKKISNPEIIKEISKAELKIKSTH
ncbi:MAG: phosphoenolpyruvate--protein phosphotransferase [Actinomycetota bacterium]